MSARLIRDMLSFRAWAIRTLAGAEPLSPPELASGPLEALLEAERCAMPLADRLGASTPAAVASMALRDAQSLLAREAALAELSRFGQGRGIPIVALKSAAHATRLPSRDLDVLVPEARLEEVVGFLAQRGLSGTRGYLDEPSLHRVHLPGRARPGEMTVEVHFQLGDGRPVDDRLWDAIRPHESRPGCFRLPAEREAWHLLWHSVVSHPHRRGQLGDLLLLAEALGDLTPAERSTIDAHVRDHPAAAPLGRALQMAVDLHAGRLTQDRFQTVAAAQYRWRTCRLMRGLPLRAAKMLEVQSFELAEGGRLGPLWERLALADLGEVPSSRPWLHRLQLDWPRTTRAVRLAVRAGVFVLILPIGVGLAWKARADGVNG